MRDIEFLKGHGTENDFVVLPDLDGTLDLTAARVRALCDRNRGLGADGVLRVVKGSVVLDTETEDARRRLADVDPDGWFMDYRNADGSIAEMCGNGLRLFAAYLVDAGLAEAGEFVVGTRSGPKPVRTHEDGSVTLHMGPARVFGRSQATVSGEAYPGVAIDVGNPHLACLIDGDPTDLDLTVPPGHDPVLFPHGVNVELFRRKGPDAIQMRVHERGVGETRSCGTGTVAAVAALLHLVDEPTGTSYVDVLGGRVRVEITEDGSTLTGPAVLVARGQLDRRWWESAS
ncbi:diaminopimelate epimerase [Kibdelosporangium phytohabitans]|uniref:diaminopimelate epimerase n=1 Tax=Kibdelosporangium phytohabitans TaxID=860235 RepID=UPI000AA897E8|nr:diaminopimelate epimerase [Kibdelosporangium phytohabitans]MBE1471161.1 diaminopimelate epimerase [Kibdelosporangium phytohabitans]